MLSVNLKKVARHIFRRAGTPSLGKRCLKALDEDRMEDLVSMEIDPRDYTDAKVFKLDYQCVNFLRKIQIDIPTIDRREVALENFWKSEKQCCATNVRFSRFNNGGEISSYESRALLILEKARSYVKRVLGPMPEKLDGRFGPGATYELRGRATTIPDKLELRATITSAARDLLPHAYETLLLGFPGRQSDPSTVRGNRFTTVPKDAKKDRGICIEPGINLWYQLGVGNVLRKGLLLRAGIDLDRSQSIHRQWAQQASHDGLKATIDLSNASDTVAWEFVKWLLPHDWFLLLNSLRSPITSLGEKAIQLEKFSSMGNGFTFELETLIFCSICHAVGCGTSGVDYRVFGDDIIVDTEHASDVLQALKFCGFTPNPRKTFVDGWFRESCGGDYFKGVEVTSHYQKVDPAEPAEWIALGNGLRRVANWRGVGFCYTPLFPAWLAVIENLPVHIRRLEGPEELGNLVIHNHDFPIDYSRGYGRVKVLKPCLRRLSLDHWPGHVVLAYAVYNSASSDADYRLSFTPKWPFPDSPKRSMGVTPRGAPKGYKIGYVAYG